MTHMGSVGGAITLGASSPKLAAAPKNSSVQYVMRHNTFVIQKYIERPLLIHGRKFDIRVWVLVSQTMDAYFFREGYLRLSSTPFDLNDTTNVENQFMHLTNYAVQKFSQSYG